VTGAVTAASHHLGSDDAATCVMVADDDAGVRSTLSEILRRAGYVVVEAEDGVVALDELGRHAVQVLVLDIRMPRCDGIAVLDAIDDPPAVLLVSAFSVDQATRARIGRKVHRYLRKPVAPRLLLDCVAEATKGAHSTDAMPS
jgi:CheY-like chemotaxis protein